MPRLARKIRNLVISACYWIVSESLRRIRRGRKGTNRGTCTVLCYHTLDREQLPSFRWQLDELIRTAPCVAPDLRDGLDNGRLYSAVTFDDAYAETLEIALPELIARHIPCTVFVPCGFMGRHPDWCVGTHLPDPGGPIVSIEQLRALSREGLGVGSHTITHPDARTLRGEEAHRELYGSRVCLERITGRPVRTFAFPYGRCTPALVEAAREAGYDRVFTVKPGPARMTSDDFVVGRVRVDPDDWRCEFRLKIRGAYAWIPVVSSAREAVRTWLLRVLLRRTSTHADIKRNTRDVPAPASAGSPFTGSRV